MKSYIIQVDTVLFRQAKLPAQWMTAFSQLGIYVHLTGNKLYPYSATISESEFNSTIELAKEL